MTDFTDDNIESILATCQENVQAIAHCLNGCLQADHRVTLGPLTPLSMDDWGDEFHGPGMVVALQVGQQGLLCLIPQTLPLPDWYTSPDETQESRLQTLGMEWSMAMLPEDLETERFETIPVDNLRQTVHDCEPSEPANCLEIRIWLAESDENADEDSAEPTARIFVVWPISSLPFASDEQDAGQTNDQDVDQVAEDAPETGGLFGFSLPAFPTPNSPPPEDHAAEDAAAKSAETAGSAAAGSSGSAASAGPRVDVSKRSRCMINLPVRIVVRLAEKKIEVGQVLALCPGTLITFSKPCEDLLDLYVNNLLYCRGEAVKIGEHFGIKVNEVGVRKVRQDAIMNS